MCLQPYYVFKVIIHYILLLYIKNVNLSFPIIVALIKIEWQLVIKSDSLFFRFGRKPLLVISGISMTVCLGILGYYFMLKDSGSDLSAIGWLPLTSLAFFNVVFSIGYGSVPFTVISEIFPPETKSFASSFSIMIHWSLVFAVTKMFPIMEDNMGQAVTFWMFSCFTLTSAAFAYFVLPETKGKTLQEIQKKLERKHKDGTKYSVEPVWKSPAAERVRLVFLLHLEQRWPLRLKPRHSEGQQRGICQSRLNVKLSFRETLFILQVNTRCDSARFLF